MNIEELNKTYETALSSVNEILADIQCKIKEFEKQDERKIKQRYKPINNETFYYLDYDGQVIEDSYDNETKIYEIMHSIGNCFKTREEAEFAVEQLKVLAELKEYADAIPVWNGYEKHFSIQMHEGNFDINFYCENEEVPFNLYFSSEAQAQKAIDAIGEDRLKKYYFCVED